MSSKGKKGGHKGGHAQHWWDRSGAIKGKGKKGGASSNFVPLHPKPPAYPPPGCGAAGGSAGGAGAEAATLRTEDAEKQALQRQIDELEWQLLQEQAYKPDVEEGDEGDDGDEGEEESVKAERSPSRSPTPRATTTLVKAKPESSDEDAWGSWGKTGPLAKSDPYI